MSETTKITIAPFRPEDQDQAKALVLAGLGDHWGSIDYSANPDLDDIAASYANSRFLVARVGDRIIGTGALRFEGERVGRIVRMSVAHDMRRTGIGTVILDRISQEAKRAGLTTLVLETTATWIDVIRFYSAYGFRPTHRDGENVHFCLNLDGATGAFAKVDKSC